MSKALEAAKSGVKTIRSPAIPRERDGIIFDEKTNPSLTKQSFKKQCDVNNIIANYRKGQLVNHINPKAGQFTDIASSVGLHDAMNVVVNAQNLFMLLPADVRKKFHNDPVALLEFAENPDNFDALVEMGLAVAPPPPEDPPAETPPAASPAA